MSQAETEPVVRSLTKALTFRFVILVADGLIVYAITHRFDITLDVMLLTNISSTVLYFIHERAWTRIHWKKKLHT